MNIKTHGKKLIALGALAILLLASVPLAMGGNAQAATAKFEPNGVYIGGGTYDGQWQEFVSDCAKQPAMRLTFVYFPSDRFDNRPTHQEQSLSRMAADGVTPVVTWQPQTYVRDIAAGKYDAYIRERARECKAFGKPMFIRYAHEANGAWYDWQKYPADVISSSQRIYRIFQEEGATNVAFVWCPAFDSGGKKNWLKYYPGDEYVDWVGLDVYNWARWPRTFDYMIKDFYNEYAGRKPIMIGEVGSAETFKPDAGFANPAAQNKAQWITDMFNDMNTKYPRIKAFVWFNVVKEDNWKIRSSAATLKAFQTGIANSRYLSKVVNGGSSPVPTTTPTVSPTVSPTVKPTVTPTAKPTATPTVTPTPTPSGDYSSTIVSHTIPDKMTPGQQYKVTVTIRNTGTAEWSENEMVRLGAVGDYSGDAVKFSKVRLTLPAGVYVHSGQEFKWSFTMTAPTTPGTYTLKYQMVWELHKWFGSVLQKQVTVG